VSKRTYIPWTKHELNLLKELYFEKLSWRKVGEHFPGRTHDACRLKALELFGAHPERTRNVTRWTNEELEILDAHWELETPKELTERLDRTEAAITSKLRRLGYTEPTGPGHWTKDEVNTLIYWWGNEPPDKTADRVGRSISGCQQKLHKMFGRYGYLQGYTTLGHVIREYGRSGPTYLKAAKELRLHPRTYQTTSGRTWTLFTDEQLDAILDHLNRPTPFVTQGGMGAHQWSRDHNQCRNCGTDGTEPQQRHAARGLCLSCHTSWRRGTITVPGLEPFKKHKRRWSNKYDCCTGCGTTARPHAGLGLCDACRRQYRKGKLEPIFNYLRTQELTS
jgi:hypothetical protein